MKRKIAVITGSKISLAVVAMLEARGYTVIIRIR